MLSLFSAWRKCYSICSVKKLSGIVCVPSYMALFDFIFTHTCCKSWLELNGTLVLIKIYFAVEALIV